MSSSGQAGGPDFRKANLGTIQGTEDWFLANLANRKSGPIRLVFVSHLYTFWNSFASVVDEMLRRETFAVNVLPVSYELKLGYGVSNIQHPLEEFARAGIPVVDHRKFNLHKERPDLVLMQTPYSNQRAVRYHPAVLAVHGTRTAVIPYCTEMIGNSGFYKSYFDWFGAVWRVFCASPAIARLYRQRIGSPDWQVPAVGNPEYDLVANRSALDFAKSRRILEAAEGRKIVLWTPHFALDNWSTWESLGRAIIEIFAQRKDDFFVVLRPHQHLAAGIDAWKPGTVPSDYHQAMAQKMHDVGNFMLDADGTAIEAVLACDALISDVSSMLAKAMALGKSLLFTSNAGHEALGLASGIFEKYAHFASGTEGVDNFASMLLSGPDPLLPVPDGVKNALCGPVDGKCAIRIADNLERYFFS